MIGLKKISNYYKDFKRRNKIKVLVSYNYSRGTESGYGHVRLLVQDKTFDIKGISEHIEKTNKMDSVIILNIIKLQGGN